jgi:hypothetical protein
VHLSERATESEIKSAALWQAGRVKTLLHSVGRSVHTLGLDVGHELNAIARAVGATPAPDSTSLQGRIARMVDPTWWTRNLRRSTLRQNEAIEHAAGHIRRARQCYVSDHASQRKRERSKANRATLESLEVASDTGEAFNLLEVSDGSVSNPKIRRGELMMRCRGFEEAAEFMGHTAIFLTITCPSRFHRFQGGTESKTWNGETPKDGQKYLCKVWAKIRAAWNKRGYTAYGFRVAEPHHDGCPHWHILLFVNPDESGWFDASQSLKNPRHAGAGIIGIAGRYALADSTAERGALKHRFTVEHIDSSKGSATGYIAKYISKNIDGEHQNGDSMGLDFDSGTSAGDASKRVRDWAATWGIRQFQQIGGPSVTVWRELRRLKEAACQLELFEKPRAAADRADWMGFWMVQGGPEVKKTQLSLKPFYVADSLGKYGDEAQRIKGVQGTDSTGTYIETTRTKEWTVQRAGMEATNAAQWEFDSRLTFGRKNCDFLAAYSDFEFQRSGEAVSTWTGVNNCNPDPFAPFDFSVFPEPEPQEFAPDHPQEVKNDVLHPVTGMELWTERLIADEKDTREAIEYATAEENRQARAWGRPTMDKATARRALRAH